MKACLCRAAALYNAMSGDLDVIRPDGTACRLYQGVWSATSPEEFWELCGPDAGHPRVP